MAGFGIISSMFDSLRGNAALLNKHKSFHEKKDDFQYKHHENESKVDFDFPKLTADELKRKNAKFKKKALKENKKEIRNSTIVFLLILLLIVLILKYLEQL
ncbi:MAG: hypothetical protein U1C58_12585 [Flavobacteriaceae bacterium]|nr:hypothetical protein [Flavobacteriaceae bacterium]MDZ4149118.1 hypothetical protein [Flavobacteriaceae bacterium]